MIYFYLHIGWKLLIYNLKSTLPPRPVWPEWMIFERSLQQIFLQKIRLLFGLFWKIPLVSKNCCGFWVTFACIRVTFYSNIWSNWPRRAFVVKKISHVARPVSYRHRSEYNHSSVNIVRLKSDTPCQVSQHCVLTSHHLHVALTVCFLHLINCYSERCLKSNTKLTNTYDNWK